MWLAGYNRNLVFATLAIDAWTDSLEMMVPNFLANALPCPTTLESQVPQALSFLKAARHETPLDSGDQGFGRQS